MNQNLPRHTSTALTAGACTVNGVNNAGASTISIAKATNSSTLIEGDIITITGFTQQYVVTTGVTLAVGTTPVAIYPPLVNTTAGGEVVVLVASHDVNLAFHRDAIAFATRPMIPAPAGMGSVSAAAQDPISGLTLRLEVTREHKRTRWSYDMLYGAAVIRRELGARLLG
jgi:hypothetical protein